MEPGARVCVVSRVSSEQASQLCRVRRHGAPEGLTREPQHISNALDMLQPWSHIPFVARALTRMSGMFEQAVGEHESRRVR